MKLHFLFLTILILFSSCKTDNPEIQLLHKKVMEVHDDVMPKTDNIHELKKKLGASLAATKDSVKVLDAIKTLDDADEAMMVWMDEFDQSYTSKSVDEQKSYLTSELERISKVKTLMLQSLDKGNQIIDSLQKNNK